MFCRRKIYIRISNVFLREHSSKVKPKVELDREVGDLLENKSLKPRKHPGRLLTTSVGLPPDITKSIKIALGDTPFKGVLKDSVKLANYLISRNYPVEEYEVNRKKTEIERKLIDGENVDLSDKSEAEMEKITKIRSTKVNKKLKETVHAWKNIQLDKYLALQYLVKRAPADYAALHRIFQEINSREENYKPTTFFDFGSGVGTGTWAARQFWGKFLQEIFTVDTSPDANDLARLVLCGGVQDAEAPIKKFFQRQFLPSTPVKYDIVLSAFSLFELPSAKSRLMTIQNLWKRTNDFLILVELGTNAGFRIINEARDFVVETQPDNVIGHVFSPCPHDLQCLRYVEDDTPCNFFVTYQPLNYDNKIEIKKMPISYVVLKKGPRPLDHQWPRIVRPVLQRSKHTICRMCCNNGQLQEVIFTKAKHGDNLYRCARACSWGDRLPVSIQECTQSNDVELRSDDNDMSEQNDSAEIQEENDVNEMGKQDSLENTKMDSSSKNS